MQHNPMASSASIPSPDAAGGAAPSGGKRGAKKSVARMADELVFALLKEKAAVHELQTLKLDEKSAKLIQFKEGLSGIRNMLAGLILDAYPPAPGRVGFEVADTAAKQVKHALVGADASYALYPELHEQLQFAFTELDYLGDAGDELAAYLKRCWLAYQGNEDAYEAPCVAMVQSSGFGKSQLLLQLAQETIEHDKWNMRVLYTCARFGKSTGYPAATVSLRDWLFKCNRAA